MNLEYTFCRYFYAERLLLPFSVEGPVSRSDERYLCYWCKSFIGFISSVIRAILLYTKQNIEKILSRNKYLTPNLALSII